MDKSKRPTSVCRRLSLTEAVVGKPIPTDPTGSENQNIKPGCTPIVLRVLLVILPLGSSDAPLDDVVKQ